MWQDLKFASRQLLRHPISNLIIVVTIALLLGAVSTIYASIRYQAKRQMPFPDPHELVKIWRTAESQKSAHYPYSLFEEFTQQLESFEHLGVTDWSRSMTMTGRGEPITFSAMKSTASVLWMTEIPPKLGRLFNEDDETPGNDQVVLLSHKTWEERFEAEPDVVGQTIRLNEKEYEIVGVLDPRLDRTHFGLPALWLPLAKPKERVGGSSQVTIVGRLKNGITRKAATAELIGKAKHIEANHSPSEFERRFSANGFESAELVSLGKNLSPQNEEFRSEMIGVMVFTIGIMTSVVLIACFNVTNLLLLRATSRAREVAIRLSIGASRIRIIRQLLSESILLAIIGSILGLSVAQSIWAAFRSQNFNAQFDLGLFIVAALTAITLGALVGMVPAIQSSRAEFTRELKDGGHASAGRKKHRTRNVLVAGQVAMAIILCVASAVMTRSYLNMHRVELGFDPANMMMISARLQRPAYTTSEDALLYTDKGLQALRESPAVDEVAASFSGVLTYFALQEEVRFHHEAEDLEKTIHAGSWFITSNLPDMLGINIVQGRGLSMDSEPLQPELLVNEQFVSENLEGVDPIGLSVHVRSLNQWMTIVGVVRDRSPLTSFQDPQAEFYASYRHAHYVGEASFLIKSRSLVKQAAQPIREIVKRIDRNQPISQAKFLPDLIDERLAGPKSAMIFLTALASFGMLIALLGIYGVVSFSVAERTHEVGIRMALGAPKGSILHLLMSQGIRLLLWGGIPGILLAFLITRGIPSQMLYRLNPSDPLTYLLVAVLIAGSGLLACLLPASKATRLRPMDALRCE